jgi:hypothetical protein
MITFLETILFRNETLFYFGTICLVSAIVLSIASRFSDLKVTGINAYYKPIKFCLSTVFVAYAMAWFTYDVSDIGNITVFNWVLIFSLGFSVFYIIFQAVRGELSHFNTSTPIFASLYSLMGISATLATLAVGYIGILYFQKDFPELPAYYVWAIRLGIILFVIFALEGFVMGSRLTHTIGGNDGGKGLPFLNWSTQFGDPRIPHFIGMHALQVLPILAYYVLKDIRLTFLVALLYSFLAIWTLVLALQGKSIFKIKSVKNNEIIQ